MLQWQGQGSTNFHAKYSKLASYMIYSNLFIIIENKWTWDTPYKKKKKNWVDG